MKAAIHTPTRNRFRLKACPRCGGDLLLDPDEDFVCLQCGRRPAPVLLERDDTTKGSALRVSSNELERALAGIIGSQNEDHAA